MMGLGFVNRVGKILCYFSIHSKQLPTGRTMSIKIAEIADGTSVEFKEFLECPEVKCIRCGKLFL